MMHKSNLQQLPDMVLVDDEPVFNEPWEAQAFAMAVHLHQQGVFTWSEWAQALADQIHGDKNGNKHSGEHGNKHIGKDGDKHSGKNGNEIVIEQRGYYQHWLAALETIVATKNLTDADELAKRKQAWHEAAARTAHGDPIEL